ncbi:MAG: deoxynucleoside kinase [Hyphomicrobiales bacterium]
MKYNFIAIEGTIGAGKTSLAAKLSETYNGKLILEEFEENSFLPKFYNEPEKYALPLEMSFLVERFQQLQKELTQQNLFHDFTVSDYFFRKCLIFAKKTLSDEEFKLYRKFFDILHASIPKPELLVYLYVSVERLQHNIKIRGREYEQKIEDNYLNNIQSGYIEFIRQQQNQRILILDVNQLDFVENENDFQKIIDVINQNYDCGVHNITLG